VKPKPKSISAFWMEAFDQKIKDKGWIEEHLERPTSERLIADTVHPGHHENMRRKALWQLRIRDVLRAALPVALPDADLEKMTDDILESGILSGGLPRCPTCDHEECICAKIAIDKAIVLPPIDCCPNCKGVAKAEREDGHVWMKGFYSRYRVQCSGCGMRTGALDITEDRYANATALEVVLTWNRLARR
jgi:hypothetical protein